MIPLPVVKRGQNSCRCLVTAGSSFCIQVAVLRSIDHAVALSHQGGRKTVCEQSPNLIGKRCNGTPVLASAEQASGELTMQGVKGLIVLSAVVAAVALGACRREVPHTPMKLGADVPATEAIR